MLHKRGLAIELTLGDLLRWKPDDLRLASRHNPYSPELDTRVSWVVCIRAMTPVLPPLRGDELIVAPRAILEELRERESIAWADVVDHLRALPIAGLLTDGDIDAGDVEGIVAFESAATLGADIEMELNRELTERRSSLYQLGSGLARMFSSASIGGLDLDGFLQLTEQRTGITVALMTLTGRVLAASNTGVNPSGSVLADAPAGGRVSSDGYDWISQPVSSVGLPEGVLLAAAISPSEPGDEARLALEQTGEALGMMFDRLSPVEPLSPGEEVQRILIDLARSGGLPAAARRRLHQFAPDLDLDGALRLLVEPNQPDAPLASDRLSFDYDGVRLSLIAEADHQRTSTCNAPAKVVSQSFAGFDELPDAARQAVRAYRLWRIGWLRGPTVDLGQPGSGGALAALLLIDSHDIDARSHLESYADAMLGDLERYDRARDMRLVETLGAYLDAGAVVAEAAQHLGVHRNTLSYRIARIADVGGHDLADPGARFDLQVAIAIRRLQTD